tara:strand:- start:950 stop:1153 length:204 start_codon:yes stop_codon:yes gene_type:complete
MNIFFFVLLLFISKQAFAYIDLGSTTVIIQSIIALFVGVFVTLGVYWNKFILFIKNLFSKNKKIKNK